MNFMQKIRPMQIAALLALSTALAGCGFHLRENANLPTQMKRVHIASSAGEFQRMLTRALEVSGVTVEDESGPGIAELRIPTAAFSTDSLNNGGYVRITEYAVHYLVQFDLADANGQVLVPIQRINMQREFSYDASNTVGTASQVQELQHSLNADAVQAILFRLEAAAKHDVTPASASSSTPVSASSTVPASTTSSLPASAASTH